MINFSRAILRAAASGVTLVCMGCNLVLPPGLAPAGNPIVATELALQASRLKALETANAGLATEVAVQSEFISYLATRSPAYVPPTDLGPPTPFTEFEGGLVIEDGRCCAGGVAGQAIDLEVAFQAHSPFAPVTALRALTGVGFLDEQALVQAPWEPFTATKTFSVTLPINWVGFYVAVQYRDGLGNVSPVFTADISLEGMPPTPTPGVGT
jgi:hypothetical protein